MPTRGVQITVQVTRSGIWRSYGVDRTYSTDAKQTLRLLTSYFGEHLVVNNRHASNTVDAIFYFEPKVFGVNGFGVKLSHDDLH